VSDLLSDLSPSLLYSLKVLFAWVSLPGFPIANGAIEHDSAVRLVYRCFYRDKLPEYSLSIRNAGIRDFHAFPVNGFRVIGCGQGLDFHAIERTKPLVSIHRILVAQALKITLRHMKRRVPEQMLQGKHIAPVSQIAYGERMT
jgi:hypothetical protein